ncbi:MAG: polysulfide reductase NrfD [Deltaproteobacteria bacterium]|nr:polysulfide reductase NrfD [Deltaproteobacteria bacterium]
MIEYAFKGSKRYWSWVIILLLIIGAGVGTGVYQWFKGLGITGMGRDIPWGFYIAQFTFLVGVAASAVMVVLPYYLHHYKTFARMTVLGEFVAIAACIMCMTFIFVDMGRPDRILNVFLHPTPNSLMFWDTVVLFGYLVLNSVIAWTTFRAERQDITPPRWIKPFIYLSIPWAFSIHTVTAFLYSGLEGRPFWMSAILAPRFLASAFAAGPALVVVACLIVRKYTRYDPGVDAIRALGKVIAYAMTANFFFIGLELFTGLYSDIPHHVHHFEYLFLGHGGHAGLVPWIWTSVLLGLIGLVMLIVPKTRNNLSTLGFASVLVFVSLWIDKGMAMVIVGFIPTPLGYYLDYHPTLPELTISAGVYAMGLLIITALYKMAITVRERDLYPGG